MINLAKITDHWGHSLKTSIPWRNVAFIEFYLYKKNSVILSLQETYNEQRVILNSQKLRNYDILVFLELVDPLLNKTEDPSVQAAG